MAQKGGMPIIGEISQQFWTEPFWYSCVSKVEECTGLSHCLDHNVLESATMWDFPFQSMLYRGHSGTQIKALSPMSVVEHSLISFWLRTAYHSHLTLIKLAAGCPLIGLSGFEGSNVPGSR